MTNSYDTDWLEQSIDTVTEFARNELGDSDRWIRVEGYPNSLALCVIDSLYSTGQHYNAVINAVNHYKKYRQEKSDSADAGKKDDIKDLLATFEAVGGSTKWAVEVAENRKPASTKAGASLKAEVIFQAAQMLHGLGIITVDDFRGLDAQALEALHRKWKGLPSQSSGITFNYVLILAGRPSIKVDRMVRRFVFQALNHSTNDVSNDQILALLERVAERLGVSPSALDHVAWRYASDREFLMADPEASPVQAL
ncbi:hypothetical protein ACTXI0_02945 [Arthrobacter rhombi]